MGSTNVRVGSTIFGAREIKTKTPAETVDEKSVTELSDELRSTSLT